MQNKTLPLIGALLAALAAIGIAALVAWHQLSGGATGVTRGDGEAVVAPGVSIGGSFSLINSEGEMVTDQDFRGTYTLIYFGYTFCPDVCPTELSSMAAALDILSQTDPGAEQQVTPVFVTIDPVRDTQEVVGSYAAAFYPRMVGLTGSEAQVDEAARKFRVFYSKGEDEGDGFYLMNHSSFTYLIGPDGSFLTMINGGTSPDSIANVLRRYIGGATS